jgi:hypothetical protein
MTQAQATSSRFTWSAIASRLARLRFNREAIYVLRALSEACLLTPWLTALALFYRPVSMLTVTSVTFVIILGMASLVRGMNALGVSANAQRGIAIGIVLILGAWGIRDLELGSGRWPDLEWLLSTIQSLGSARTLVPASLVILLAAVFLLWRGLRLGQRTLSVFDAWIGFQIGILLFALFILLSSPQSKQEANPSIVTFFFCQLLAMGLTRVETLGEYPGGRRSQFGGWWFGMLTTSTIATVALAGAILTFVLGVGPEYILLWLQPIIAILALLLSVVIVPILLAAGLTIDWLSSIIRMNEWLTQFQIVQEPGVALPTVANAGPQSPIVKAAVQMLSTGKGLLVLVLVILVVVSIIWITGRMQTKRKTAEDEEYESIWSAGLWAARLRNRLRQQFKKVTAAAGQLRRLGLGGLFTALTIRRIYSQLQKLAARRGYPRNPAWTPFEYLPVLIECLPACQADLNRITQAYVGVHYGELPETPAEMADIRAAWERIRQSHSQND